MRLARCEMRSGPDSQERLNDLMAHGSWLMAHGSWLMAHGAWRMAHGALPRRSAAGEARSAVFPGALGALGHLVGLGDDVVERAVDPL
jgi:hypothetical protein